MSSASIDILLINTVIPYKYAYRMLTTRSAAAENEERNAHRAFGELELMEQIAPEDNTSQHHECVNCEVGYRIFFANNTFPL